VILPAFNERRRTPRHVVRQIGTILTEPDFEAPSEFVLRVADTETTSKIAWRDCQVIGAERLPLPARNQIFTARLSIHRMDIEEAVRVLLFGTLIAAFVIAAVVVAGVFLA
jgi:hypothetical protein